MTDQGIKSRPRYHPLAIDVLGRRHLLLGDTAELPAKGFAEGTGSGNFDERWTLARGSMAIPDPVHPADKSFRSENHMLIALRHHLGSETMGLRLYAIGMEPFLWAIFNVAHEAGMSREEIHFFAHGSEARRVFAITAAR